MSLWDNVKKFTQPYADDDYDDYDEDEYEEEYEEPVRPVRKQTQRRPAPAPVMDEEEMKKSGPILVSLCPVTPVAPAAPTGLLRQVLNMNTASSASNKQEVVLFRPGSFNDTSKAADDLRNHKAVIVNMENVEKAMARRVVDFLSGCVYALDGDVKKIAQSAYLFCPHNMDIVGDLETLQAEVESYI